jgi:hypothetical protein
VKPNIPSPLTFLLTACVLTPPPTSPADVYVDGQLTQRHVTCMDLVLPPHPDRQTEIRVRAPGYEDWPIAVRGGGTRTLIGPVEGMAQARNVISILPDLGVLPAS